jgi:Phage protein (N4 Gp49/phage Sf6 gene 66) family
MVTKDMIKDKKFLRIGEKTTICLLTLDNGFEIVGTSACVDPANFDYEIGKECAEEDAIRRLGDIEGFLLTEYLHLEKTKQQEDDQS